MLGYILISLVSIRLFYITNKAVNDFDDFKNEFNGY